MNPADVAPMVVMTVISVSVAAILILRGPVGRALARRLEGVTAPDPELAMRVEELESRMFAAEQLEGRLAELEERLDFAERLNANEKKVPLIRGEV